MSRRLWWAQGNFTFHADDVVARFGDVRRNVVHSIDSPQLASPWGYGPSSADPETGEIISGMAYDDACAANPNASGCSLAAPLATLDELSYHCDYLDILRGMVNVYGEATWLP